MESNKIELYRELEKKFSIFRWILILIVAPTTLNLSEFHSNGKLMLFALILGGLYNLIVTIAAYSQKKYFQWMLGLTLYFDIPVVSLLLFTRGGLRSDTYLIYYLVILYDGAKYGIFGTINSLIQSIIYYTIAAFFFTAPEDFDQNRYIIRIIYLSTLTFVMYEINKQIANSLTKAKIAKEQAHKDPLTQLPNRLLMSEFYEKIQQLSENQNNTFCVALFDVDNFKLVNDNFGHPFGDSVLVTFGDILKNNVSKDDFACRLGGDEFLIFFANTNEDIAISKVNKIRKDFEEYDFSGHSFTLSCGVNEYKKEFTMIENISFADEAMYDVKKAGKNNVNKFLLTE